ncbi:RteC domain-containing protein [Mucilaginibacter sp. UYCu711]|uniref:RteC domain-containing protein n=1 Tax=Mucilaginibacter sp. UYCu711 TaxID=3156339 RepID=UPI003D25ECEE
MNQKFEKMKSKLVDDLDNMIEHQSPLEKLSKASGIVESAIQELNELIAENNFDSPQDEILFFKKLRPEIFALRIEEVFRYNLAVNKPIGTSEIQVKYFEEELKALQSFFRMNSFHYQYYKNGLTNLDHICFLRGAGPLPVPLAEFSETDREFTTPMSNLFARFIAYEHMQYFILEQITPLKYPELMKLPKNGGQFLDMKWTGDSINIVELAYGIWLTGQLNNGNASLNQIVKWLEANLHVNIGVVQRRFIEIERRKRLSPTKYIDQMRDTIRQKIDRGNS